MSGYEESDIFDVGEKIQMKFLNELKIDMEKLLKDFAFKSFKCRDELLHGIIHNKKVPIDDDAIKQVKITNDDIQIIKRKRGRPPKKMVRIDA